VAEFLDREHFIPLRKHDLMELLVRDKQLPLAEREPFRQFGRLVSAAIHFEYLAKLEELKDAYAPFDPDADTKPCEPLFPEERKGREDKVFAAFASLMQSADFRQLNQEAIHRAVQQTPDDWGLNMDLDLNVFERLEVYERGEVIGGHTRRSWRGLWRLEKVKVPLYQRLALILKLKPHHRIDANLDVNLVYFKLFKDVPRADVDMLLPGSRPRIRPMDRALIFWPLAVGLALLLYHFTQVLPRFELNELVSLASLSLAAAFCGYAYRSFHNYIAKRQTYILQLIRSLYFKALDSNTGVLMRLLDEAEEQQCREAFLAYFCLSRFAPPEGWTAEQLDDYVEMYLEGTAGLKVDFDVGAALMKLEQMRVVEKENGHYRALTPDKAVDILHWTWDNYFMRAKPSSKSSAV
jgi:Protein of unknown function (DUF3754)